MHFSGPYVQYWKTEIYNLAINNYTDGPDLPHGPYYSYVVVDGIMMAIADIPNTVYEYDEVNNAWNLVPGILTGPSGGTKFDSSLVYVGDAYVNCFPP